MKSVITGFITLLLPSTVAVVFLRVMGHKMGKNVKIGFSFLKVNHISIGNDTIIGNFNAFFNERLVLEESVKIGYLNFFKGPFDLMLEDFSAIGNKNYFTRGKKGVTYGNSELKLGTWTKITVGHHLDLTRSILFGEYSILAGIRSQLWTHGYYHAESGKERVRIDGSINIGDNVYVGSGCIINPGVNIANAIHVGSGTVVSKTLTAPGMYVGQGLRHIKKDLEMVKKALTKVEDDHLIETVYTKDE